ncbi:expressed protein [Chlorella variabilis]|uniref:Expressed protein n=1 Tax=Chlorella variabilis TaxID=554065 RepID=E1ZCR6_CHLVA|nr:expressed protein [Chlorella variabilis]EFN56286.1 expressed protein [Chlorella variabilis]|eukprot:XP_005848388.1 expressed protein [Chlorella variabilis]
MNLPATSLQQLLWRLSDACGPIVRAFCQQHVQGAQLDREALRLQRELEKLLERHIDRSTAPTAPALVKLELRVSMPHLESIFYDEPLWDLSAPRAACEDYISTTVNELGLDWHAHTLIMRRMKERIDIATKACELAMGKVQPLPSSNDKMLRNPPSKLPQVVRMTEQQLQQVAAALAARHSGSNQQEGAGRPLPVLGTASGVKVEQVEDKPSVEPRAAGAAKLEPSDTTQGEQQQQHNSDDSDMPDLPE